MTALLNSTALLPIALAATDPLLEKVVSTRETLVMLNVDIGKAFGKAIAPAHVEPLRHDEFWALYAEPLAQHIKSKCGYATDRSVIVCMRTANLVAAGKSVPTRTTVKKKSGADKPLSDTAYTVQLLEAQKAAGLTIVRPGNGGDNRTPAQIAEAAAKAATDAADAAKKAAAAGVQVPPVAPVEPAPQVPAKGNDANPKGPDVPPTIDLAKVREDAAATIMGSAKHGDLLLRAVKSKKAALIKWLEDATKA